MVWPWQARRLLQEAGLEVFRVDYLFIFARLLKGLRFLEKRVSPFPIGAAGQIFEDFLFRRRPACGRAERILGEGLRYHRLGRAKV